MVLLLRNNALKHIHVIGILLLILTIIKVGRGYCLLKTPSILMRGVGVADVVKAPVHHVDTAVVGVRVPSPAEEKTHIG